MGAEEKISVPDPDLLPESSAHSDGESGHGEEGHYRKASETNFSGSNGG